LVDGGVACLGAASGLDRQSDLRHTLYLVLIEKVKGNAVRSGPDKGTKKGKNIIHCQPNNVFEEMALLMSLLSPEERSVLSSVFVSKQTLSLTPHFTCTSSLLAFLTCRLFLLKN